MELVFVKHGMRGYGFIEAGIERAAREIAGLALRTFDLGAHYHGQQGELRDAPHPRRMQDAVKALLAELVRERADTVLILNGFVVDWYRPGFFRVLKGAGMRVAGWQIDEPYYVDRNRRFVHDLDLLLSVDSSTLPVYREMLVQAEFLPLACDPALHKSYEAAAPYACEVCFVGAPFAGSRRARLIDEAARCLARRDTRIVGATELDGWKKSLVNFSVLERAIRDEAVAPEQAARYFSAAKVNLNLHKDSSGHAWDRNTAAIAARSPNERTFAIAGCGGFQLIDDTRPDLAAYFAPGQELVTFSDAADLEKKIDYYLGHEDERRAIAAAAQARAYRQHTYRHRLEAVLALL